VHFFHAGLLVFFCFLFVCLCLSAGQAHPRKRFHSNFELRAAALQIFLFSTFVSSVQLQKQTGMIRHPEPNLGQCLPDKL
jgi:NADH:ubiquinone oxidoreductase subunit 6 (subunit J)